MSNRRTELATAVAGLLALGMSVHEPARAIATISLTTNSPTVYLQGSTNLPMTVDFSVKLGEGSTVEDVLVYAGAMVAYNPAVLKFNSIELGTGLSVGTPGEADYLPAEGSMDTPADYRNPFSGSPTWILHQSVLDTNVLGTPDTSTVAAKGYVEGSLWPHIQTNGAFNADGGLANATKLLAKQLAGVDVVLFSIVFDVVTTNIADSSIVLIDDEDYDQGTSPMNFFDYKHWVDGAADPMYVASNALLVQIQSASAAPAPTALLLVATGLIGIGRARDRTR